jgi:cytochrome b6-f complex iron-sulfur subunit
MTRISRREVLRLASGGVALAAIGASCETDGAAPKVEEVRVAPGEIPASGADPLHSNPGRFYLLNDNQPLALYARCTHRGCLIEWDGEEDGFRCPCHGSRFDRVGQVVNGPAERPLERMRVVPQPDGGLLVQTRERSRVDG